MSVFVAPHTHFMENEPVDLSKQWNASSVIVFPFMLVRGFGFGERT